MKSLFWKKAELQVISQKPGSQLKFQPGSSLTFLQDQKKIVAFGRVKIESSQEQSKEVKEEPKKNTFSFKGGFSLVEKQVAVIDALQVYDSQTGKWNISNCTGRHPNVRSYHYAIYESPHLVIYGGIDKKALNDMFVLNCKTLVWKKMFNLESPPARIAGAFVSLKDKKYLIGGCKYPQTPTDLYGDIWSLSFANVNWQISANDIPGSVWASVEFNNVNNIYKPTKHFTANAVGQELIYIFGGFTANNEPSNRQYLFNAQTKEMILVESKGPKPIPRGKHRMINVRPNLLVMYGGSPHCESDLSKLESEIYIYHADLATWQRPIIGGSLPHDLAFFNSCLKVGQSKPEIMLLGCKAASHQVVQYELISNMQDQSAPKSISVQKQKEHHKEKQKNMPQQTRQHNTIEQQLQEGYKMTEQQRFKIEQLEETLAVMKRDNEDIKIRIERSKESYKDETEEPTQNIQFTSKVRSLLLMEYKKRRFLELKSHILQNTIKDAEKLVVMLDGFSQEEAKVQHINIIKEFRKQMEDIWLKETALRKEINSKKSGLSFDLNKMFLQGLSEEESRLIAML